MCVCVKNTYISISICLSANKVLDFMNTNYASMAKVYSVSRIMVEILNCEEYPFLKGNIDISGSPKLLAFLKQNSQKVTSLKTKAIYQS